jgi:hypothetical protein
VQLSGCKACRSIATAVPQFKTQNCAGGTHSFMAYMPCQRAAEVSFTIHEQCSHPYRRDSVSAHADLTVCWLTPRQQTLTLDAQIALARNCKCKSRRLLLQSSRCLFVEAAAYARRSSFLLAVNLHHLTSAPRKAAGSTGAMTKSSKKITPSGKAKGRGRAAKGDAGRSGAQSVPAAQVRCAHAMATATCGLSR